MTAPAPAMHSIALTRCFDRRRGGSRGGRGWAAGEEIGGIEGAALSMFAGAFAVWFLSLGLCAFSRYFAC